MFFIHFVFSKSKIVKLPGRKNIMTFLALSERLVMQCTSNAVFTHVTVMYVVFDYILVVIIRFPYTYIMKQVLLLCECLFISHYVLSEVFMNVWLS